MYPLTTLFDIVSDALLPGGVAHQISQRLQVVRSVVAPVSVKPADRISVQSEDGQ